MISLNVQSKNKLDIANNISTANKLAKAPIGIKQISLNLFLKFSTKKEGYTPLILDRLSIYFIYPLDLKYLISSSITLLILLPLLV